MGHERLIALISKGIESGEFSTENPRAAAKMIQNIILGSLLSRFTEIQAVEENVTEKTTLETCLSLIQKKS